MTAVPPLGEKRVWDHTCGYEVGGSYCAKPGVLHLMWDQEMENSIVCAEHVVVAYGWPVRDSHPPSPACTMPGSSWDFDEKRCVIDGLDDDVPELVAAVEDSP